MTTTTLTRSGRSETTAEYNYDYAGQDPVNSYDLSGEVLDPDAIGRGLTFEQLTLESMGLSKNNRIFSTSHGRVKPDLWNPVR